MYMELLALLELIGHIINTNNDIGCEKRMFHLARATRGWHRLSWGCTEGGTVHDAPWFWACQLCRSLPGHLLILSTPYS